MLDVPRDPEKEMRSLEILSVYNISTVDFKDTHRKNYHLRGRSAKSPRGQKIGATAAACWLWFGDPDKRPGSKRDGSVKTWGEELRRLEARHNEHVWKEIVAGNIFCPQLGRGAVYYSAIENEQVIDEQGMNLGEDELSALNEYENSNVAQDGTQLGVSIGDADELIAMDKSAIHAVAGKRK